jgi:hypothetical protein
MNAESEEQEIRRRLSAVALRMHAILDTLRLLRTELPWIPEPVLSLEVAPDILQNFALVIDHCREELPPLAAALDQAIKATEESLQAELRLYKERSAEAEKAIARVRKRFLKEPGGP